MDIVWHKKAAPKGGVFDVIVIEIRLTCSLLDLAVTYSPTP